MSKFPTYTEESSLWEGDGFLSQKEKVKKDEDPISKSRYDMREIYRTTTPWEMQVAVTEWEQGKCDKIKYTIDPLLTEKRDEFAPGTCPGGPHIGEPVFQFLPLHKSFEEGGTKIAESDNCLSFIPAGFRNGKTPNTMNPVREVIGGSSALMSLVHVLTIPKHTRIYNAATLSRNHLSLLEEMKQLGEKSVKYLMGASNTTMGSFKWVYSQDDTIEMNDGRKLSSKVISSDLSPSCVENYHRKIKDPTILNSFHVYPSASIGWLHLHSYVGELVTTAHDTMEKEAKEKGYHKNVPYDVIVSQLNNV
jgi:hypothetical protein